jgi:hypothetical protein
MIGHGFRRMIAITRATVDDAEEILRLQKLAYQSEAELYGECALPPLTQSIESLRSEFDGSVVLKAMSGERIVGLRTGQGYSRRVRHRKAGVSTHTQTLSPTVSITCLEKPMSIRKGRPMAGAQ